MSCRKPYFLNYLIKEKQAIATDTQTKNNPQSEQQVVHQNTPKKAKKRKSKAPKGKRITFSAICLIKCAIEESVDGGHQIESKAKNNKGKGQEQEGGRNRCIGKRIFYYKASIRRQQTERNKRFS